MAKWVLLQGTTVNNVIVPGPPEVQAILESEGFEVVEENDEVRVAPGWTWNEETQEYVEPSP